MTTFYIIIVINYIWIRIIHIYYIWIRSFHAEKNILYTDLYTQSCRKPEARWLSAMLSTDNILELINESLGFSTKLKGMLTNLVYSSFSVQIPYKMFSYSD